MYVETKKFGAGGGGEEVKAIQLPYTLVTCSCISTLSSTNPLHVHVQIIHGKSTDNPALTLTCWVDDLFIHRTRVGIVPAGACVHVVEYTG